MQKIVINTKWGGASLSKAAAEWLVERKGTVFDDCFDRESDYFSIESITSRSDPDYVAVIEQMGRRADGSSSRMEVIGIPDGADWEIMEYDGAEWIVEKHRTWFAKTFSSQRYLPSSIELKNGRNFDDGEFLEGFIEIALCVKGIEFAISVPAYRRFQEIRGNEAPIFDPTKLLDCPYGVPLRHLKVPRSHPHLIQLIKELGETAFPRDTVLGIARVPAGVSWQIEEQEACEWIAEKHRAWFYPKPCFRHCLDEKGKKFFDTYYSSRRKKMDEWGFRQLAVVDHSYEGEPGLSSEARDFIAGRKQTTAKSVDIGNLRRDDHDLISAIATLGRDAGASNTSWMVIEIPGDLNWRIVPRQFDSENIEVGLEGKFTEFRVIRSPYAYLGKKFSRPLYLSNLSPVFSKDVPYVYGG